MNYELALKLKECADCKIPYKGGNRSSRCKSCQLKIRREMNKEWQHRYYLANKEKINSRVLARQNYRRKTDENFRLKEISKWHNRQAIILGNGGSHTAEEWLEVCKKWSHCCVFCGKPKKLTRDHIVPISKGGTNDINNIQPLCASCNSSKRDYDKPRFVVKA